MYLHYSGVSLVNVRTSLLDRESAAQEMEGLATGLQGHHSTGIEALDTDECCTNKLSGHDFNCDANMRRYRKYYKTIQQTCIGLELNNVMC